MPSARPFLRLGLLLLLAFAACGRSNSSLYPLSEGRSWTYQLQIDSSEGAVAASTAEITNMPTRTLADKTVTPNRIEAEGSTYFTFIAEGDEGICEIANQAPNSPDPVLHPVPLCYLKRPYEKGTTWDLPYKSQLLAPGTQTSLTASIVGDEETLTVPAGTFEDCTRVEGSGGFERDAGMFMGKARVSVEYYAWYCPGVGLVKYIAKELSAHASLDNGEITYQLLEYSS